MKKNIDLVYIETLMEYKNHDFIMIFKEYGKDDHFYLSNFYKEIDNSLIRKKQNIICRLTKHDYDLLKEKKKTFYECFKNNKCFLHITNYEDLKLFMNVLKIINVFCI